MPLTWIALLLISILLGWLASVIDHAASGSRILTLIALAVGGAVFGAMVVTPLLAGPVELDGFSLPALLLSLLGPLVLLVPAVLLRRGQGRRQTPSGASAPGDTQTGSGRRQRSPR